MNIIEKQLDYLNDSMKEKAVDANSFLLKYHFGGLIAIIALLNVDLVLADKVAEISPENLGYFWTAIFLIIVLSFVYFYVVLLHYRRFARSHRKLKYKYELTLHCSLCDGLHRDYQFYLEKSIAEKPIDKFKDELVEHRDTDYKFPEMAEYLLHHHRKKYQKLEFVDVKYLLMALSVIALTLSIRGIFLFIG